MTVVTLEEAKVRMEELVHRAAGGESVHIAVDGKLMLELRPVSRAPSSGAKRVGGQWKGLFEVGPEFFEPMPEDWMKEFHDGPVFPADELKGTIQEESQERRRIFGQWEGLVELSPDFFDPLSDEEVALFTEGAVFPGSAIPATTRSQS